MQLIDSHAHLTFSPISEHLDAVLHRAAGAGVIKMVVPAYNLESWEPISAIVRNEAVFGAFGLHPWVADEPLDIETLTARLRVSNAVAVGEIGLDFKIAQLDKGRQIDIFIQQINVAVENNLPVILHCRGAFMEMLHILKGHKGKIRGVIHGFSKGPDIAEEFLKLGFFIGFGGAVTRPNAKRARQSAIHIPLERIVLETDCPSIGVDGVAAEQTEPMHVADIAKSLAQLRNISIQEVGQQTTQNAHQLFLLSGY